MPAPCAVAWRVCATRWPEVPRHRASVAARARAGALRRPRSLCPSRTPPAPALPLRGQPLSDVCPGRAGRSVPERAPPRGAGRHRASAFRHPRAWWRGGGGTSRPDSRCATSQRDHRWSHGRVMAPFCRGQAVPDPPARQGRPIPTGAQPGLVGILVADRHATRMCSACGVGGRGSASPLQRGVRHPRSGTSASPGRVTPIL